MVVSLVAVAGPDPSYLAVGVVADHVLTLAKACVVALPPGEHRLSLVGLHLEVELVLLIIALKGMEPYRLPPIVEDHRCVLARTARPRLLLRGDEDVTRRRTLRLRPYLDGGWAEIWTRTEGPWLLPPCRRSDSPGARAPLTAQGASQRDPGATGSHSLKESSSRDLRAQSFVPPSLSRSLVAHHTEGLDISRNRGYPASGCIVHWTSGDSMDTKTVAGEDRSGQTKPVGFWEAFWFWVKLGFINFGGPAGQIAIMHRELVERKRWVSEKQYLRTLNFCMLLPGPEAQQVATYIGWRLHGTLGGIVAGSFFVIPS